MTRFIAIICTLLVSQTIAAACPLISEYVDFNCDGKLRTGVVGDSIVSGVGDGQFRPHGYPARFKKAVKPVAKIGVVAAGFPGITSGRLLATFQQEYARQQQTVKGTIAYRMRNVDLIIVDVGRNDYWSDYSPATTARNIKRLVKLLRNKNKQYGVRAYVIAATLLPTTRSFQAPFVNAVNALLLAQSSNGFPVVMRFDRMPTNLLIGDGLHPGSGGYDWMSELMKSVYADQVQNFMRNWHTDVDQDEVYDVPEVFRFSTDPLKPDTDDDGYLDGQELFELTSNPLDPNDPDLQDPLASPEPSIEPTESPTATPSATVEMSPTMTPTATPTESPSASPTPSAQSSASASPSTSPSASPSSSPMAP